MRWRVSLCGRIVTELNVSKILLVEDDDSLSFSVASWLRRQRHMVECRQDGRSGLEFGITDQFDLVILDWELPEISGAEICRQLRAASCSAPILFLTGRASIKDKQECFDAGADDYITKPFAMEELVMRVQALLRRPRAMQAQTRQIGDITLDSTALKVTVANQVIELRPKEFSIVELLIRHPDQVFEADAIIAKLWPVDSDATVYNLRPQIARLRRKFEERGVSLIRTVRGSGYALNLEALNMQVRATTEET